MRPPSGAQRGLWKNGAAPGYLATLFPDSPFRLEGRSGAFHFLSCGFRVTADSCSSFMRILAVNKYYQLTGGGDRFFFDTEAVLLRHGHEVIPFCLKYPGNLPTPFDCYFPEGVSGKVIDEAPWSTRLRSFRNGVYSKESFDAIKALATQVRPDVAQLHILHYAMSPSVIDALDALQIPIVFTLHDYRIVCVGGFLYANGKECHDCRGGRFVNALKHRCYRDSYFSTVMGVVANYVYRAKRIYDKVDLFTVPHTGMLELLVDFGLPRQKLRVLRNPLVSSSEPPQPTLGDEVLFFGNVSAQKGVFTLLKAAKSLPSVPFVICGSGLALTSVRKEVLRENLRNVRIDDHSRMGNGLERMIAAARLVVSPSEWPTPLEYVTLEAMAFGKAVVASRIGGNQAVVQDGESGILFSPGNAAGLADAVRRLYDDPAECQRLGGNAKAQIERDFTEESFCDSLLAVFQEARIGRRTRSSRD